MRWVTSDTHFGQTKILEYCPWRKTWAASIEEHDRKLIEAWNGTVHPDDVVYHIGDFAFGKRTRIAEIRAQLNGKIMLVKGNHDKSGMAKAGFEVMREARFDHGGLYLACRHNPAHFTNAELVESNLLLHGHWHGDDHRDRSAVSAQYAHKLVDVGIDARKDIRPASLDSICARHRVSHVMGLE